MELLAIAKNGVFELLKVSTTGGKFRGFENIYMLSAFEANCQMVSKGRAKIVWSLGEEDVSLLRDEPPTDEEAENDSAQAEERKSSDLE